MNIIEDRVENNPWFEIGVSSILGTRSYQQDFAYFYTGNQEVLAVVCDGMGGLQGGERASKTAVQLMARDFQREKPIKNIPAFLHREAGRMDQAVAALKNDQGKPLGGGTTLVAVYCNKNQMHWVSVGDSRIYFIRGGKITSENREHNYRLMLQEQLATGKITREFYQKEEKTPQAEALISFLGMNGLKVVDVKKTPTLLRKGDMIMLCSDGVYKSLNDSQVCAMALDNDLDMYIAADRTTAMALRYGQRGQDNTTVILMKYLGE